MCGCAHLAISPFAEVEVRGDRPRGKVGATGAGN